MVTLEKSGLGCGICRYEKVNIFLDWKQYFTAKKNNFTFMICTKHVNQQRIIHQFLA